MARKYIDDLGIKFEDTPQGWCLNDNRQDLWESQRNTFGFDSRETWGLDFTFMLWLYERLSMYNQVNCVDTSYHKFEYKNEVLTQQDCIDRLLEGSKIYLTVKNYDWTEEQKEKVFDVVNLFALCFWSLWW